MKEINLYQDLNEKVRRELGSFNNPDQTVEWCVQNMRTELETKSATIEAMKKVIRKHKLSI